jgi:hypothetical protein
MDKFIPCSIKELPVVQHYQAALHAIWHNPVNAPRNAFTPAHIAVMTQKYWGDRVKDLTYGFMERVSVGFQQKIDLYANKWNAFSKAKFRFTNTDPIIRIAFLNEGYYSYIGTDCELVPRNQHTMNLQGFTLQTPDSEWDRVVPHECGHGLGAPHEHQRKAIVDRLDKQKTYAYFLRDQGWQRDEVDQQVLISLEERSLMGASPADETSIMTYGFPGSITIDGRPILGGTKISPIDVQYFSKIYPRDDAPIPISKKRITIEFDGNYRIVDSVSV